MLRINNKFKPLNYRLLCKSILRLKKKFNKKTISRINATNRYIYLRHMHMRLYILLSTARRLYYSRHLFICHYLMNLLKKTSTYSINQGLVQKKVGFQDLKKKFSQLGISIFLLARKDMNYLRAYGKKNINFNSLFFGGYTFVVYLNDVKVNKEQLDKYGLTNNAVNSFYNFYKFFLTNDGLNVQLLKLVNFAKLFPLAIRFVGYFYSKDVVVNYLVVFFSIFVRSGQMNKDLEAFFTIEKVKKMCQLLLSSTKGLKDVNVHKLIIKNFIVNIMTFLIQLKFTKIKMFFFKLNLIKLQKEIIK